MTETMGTTPSNTPGTQASTRDVAKDEARGVAQDAVQGGKQTAETAKQQAGEVANEAVNHAKNLLGQTREQLTSQGAAQQEKAATGLRTLADELSGIANGTSTSGSGVAADLARQASGYVEDAARWLETRDPSDLLNDVRRFARQRPGAFLGAAAAIGFLGGRLTRGMTSDGDDNSSSSRSYDSSYGGTYSGTYTGTASLSTAPSAAPLGGQSSVPSSTGTYPTTSDSTTQFAPRTGGESRAGEFTGTGDPLAPGSLGQTRTGEDRI